MIVIDPGRIAIKKLLADFQKSCVKKKEEYKVQRKDRDLERVEKKIEGKQGHKGTEKKKFRLKFKRDGTYKKKLIRSKRLPSGPGGYMPPDRDYDRKHRDTRTFRLFIRKHYYLTRRNFFSTWHKIRGTPIMDRAKVDFTPEQFQVNFFDRVGVRQVQNLFKQAYNMGIFQFHSAKRHLRWGTIMVFYSMPDAIDEKALRIVEKEDKISEEFVLPSGIRHAGLGKVTVHNVFETRPPPPGPYISGSSDFVLDFCDPKKKIKKKKKGGGPPKGGSSTFKLDF